MRVRTAEEFERLAARPAHTPFVYLFTRPAETRLGSVIDGIGFIAPDIAAEPWYVEAPDLPLSAVLNFVMSRDRISTYDAYETSRLFYQHYQVTPAIMIDARTVAIHVPLTTEYVESLTPNTWDLMAPRIIHDMVRQLTMASQRKLMRAASIDVLAATELGRHAAMGYTRDGTTLFPQFRVGNGRITSAAPNVIGTKRVERYLYRADALSRWYALCWEDPELTCLAIAVGSARFAQATMADLATLWGTTPEDAQRSLWDILNNPQDPVKEANGWDRRQALLQWEPKLAERLAVLKEEVERDGAFRSYLGRLVPCTEVRKALALDVQSVESSCLKMLIAAMGSARAGRPDMMAGFKSLIPVYTKVYYQLDAHIPVEWHARYMHMVAQLEPIPDVRFRVTVDAGPSWGDLRPVDHAFAQTEAELLQPAQYPIPCPVCFEHGEQRVAPDEPTLRDHLVDDHPEQIDESRGSRTVDEWVGIAHALAERNPWG